MLFSDIKFSIVRHANDWVYAFDIPNTGGRFHGYTFDKLTNFNVFDEITKGYTSYDKPAFEAWLATLGTQSTNRKKEYKPIVYTGMPFTDFGLGFNATPLIIIGAALLIGWLVIQK